MLKIAASVGLAVLIVAGILAQNPVVKQTSPGLPPLPPDDKKEIRPPEHAAPILAPENVTEWKIGMYLRFPETTQKHWFMVTDVLDNDNAVIVGYKDITVPNAYTTPFVLRTGTKNLVDDKKIDLSKIYQVIATIKIPTPQAAKKTRTVYVIQ